jgi:hypothetical protein
MRPILATYKTIRVEKSRGHRMNGLKTILALCSLVSLFLATPAAAQMDPYGMGDQWDMGGGMGSPFGGFGMSGMTGMPFGMGSVEVYRAPAWENTDKSLMATLDSVPDLSMFAAAVRETGYGDKLNSAGTYIVFAAPNKAMKRDLSVSSVESLLANDRLVRGLVNSGIVLKADEPNELSRVLPVKSVGGRDIYVRKEKTGMAANGADVIKIFKTTNGYLLVTDAAVGT